MNTGPAPHQLNDHVDDDFHVHCVLGGGSTISQPTEQQDVVGGAIYDRAGGSLPPVEDSTTRYASTSFNFINFIQLHSTCM